MARLAVTATGMVTAVGFNSAASCAAMRAGISGVTKGNLWDNESGEPITVGKVDLPHWWVGRGKLVELVAPAINECLEAAKPTPRAQIPILLGISDKARPHRFIGMEDQLLEEVEVKLNAKHNPESSTIPRERISGVAALNEIRRIFKSGRVPCCIIAGVDSFLQQEVVDAYVDQRRILTPSNSNGFIPGEAGCAALVMPEADSRRSHLEIIGIGFAREAATIESDKPMRAEGLTQAVRAALTDAGIAMHDTSYRITDLNGEHYKFKEAAIVEGRLLQKKMIELYDLWHPNEYLGDIGAAIVPCVLAVALYAGQKAYGPGSRALCHFGNDDGERAALITQFRPGTPN
jgi:3-oxoacyl-[acyl-carrier-protein] synthase-1